MDYELRLMFYGVVCFGFGIVFAFFLFYAMARIGRDVDDKEKS